MRFPAPAALAVWLLAGCAGGGSMNTMLTAASPSPVPDVFACARQQVKALDFDQTSLDVKDFRLTAKRYDEKVTRPDVRFHRLVDRLEIEAAPAADGGALTKLTVTARTFADVSTHRGPTEEQERPSETVRNAAQKIVERCGGEVAPAPDAG
jgi:hypothetical protein